MVRGYGTDYTQEVSQCTSGFSNFIISFSIICILAAKLSIAPGGCGKTTITNLLLVDVVKEDIDHWANRATECCRNLRSAVVGNSSLSAPSPPRTLFVMASRPSHTLGKDGG